MLANDAKLIYARLCRVEPSAACNDSGSCDMLDPGPVVDLSNEVDRLVVRVCLCACVYTRQRKAADLDCYLAA